MPIGTGMSTLRCALDELRAGRRWEARARILAARAEAEKLARGAGTVVEGTDRDSVSLPNCFFLPLEF